MKKEFLEKLFENKREEMEPFLAQHEMVIL